MSDSIWPWEGDAGEAALRTRLAEAIDRVPGPCVLDVKEEGILSYAQSDFSFVEKDFRLAFPEAVAHQLEDAICDEVKTCLVVRRELINYKKLCLHLWKAGSVVEKDLRQLASFYFVDLVNTEPTLEQRALYAEVANEMNECRGVLSVIWDARYFGKTICGTPRHPDSGVPWKFEELPESLEVYKCIEKAKTFVDGHAELDAQLAMRWSKRTLKVEASDDIAAATASNEETQPHTQNEMPRESLEPVVDSPAEEGPHPSSSSRPAAEKKKDWAWKSERVLVQSPLSREGLTHLMSLIDATEIRFPEGARRYIELALIGRGMSKALTIRTVLRRYCAALRSVLEMASKVQKDLRNMLDFPGTQTSIAAGLHLLCEKHWRTMRGVTSTLPEMLHWLEPMADLTASSERLFVSGAKGACAFVPRGFPDLLLPYRTFAKEHRGVMAAALRRGEWPKSARPAAEEEVHLVKCQHCSNKYTRLWLHRELCFVCEAKLRDEGKCPYNARCGSASFCPHERCCIVCEQHSCEACKLLRGDGEDVWQLVNQHQPDIVFLDFDRTLATTKRGASPLIGNHSIDPELANVCGSHPNVQIVTRSSRREDIQKFLQDKGVPIKSVHSLRLDGRKNKAEVIVEELENVSRENAFGLFVDDDIKELTDPSLERLVESGKLLRLLFARAGGKE